MRHPGPEAVPVSPARPAAGVDLRGLGALLLLAVMWGASIPVIKLGLRDLPPLTLTALRYVTAVPFFAWSLRHHWEEVRRHLGPLALLAVLNAIPGQVLQTVAVRYTTATVATLLSATIPLWFVALASLRLGQRLGRRQWTGLAVAMGGITLLVVGDPRDLSGLWSSRAFTGNLFILGSAASVALFYALSAGLGLRLSPMVVAGGTSVLGAVALVPFSLWELVHQPLRPTATVTGIGAVLYLAVLVTYVGLQIWLTVLQKVPASIAGALQYLQPVVGVSLSALLLGETLTAHFAAGAVLVLVGIGVVTSGSRRREPG